MGSQELHGHTPDTVWITSVITYMYMYMNKQRTCTRLRVMLNTHVHITYPTQIHVSGAVAVFEDNV